MLTNHPFVATPDWIRQHCTNIQHHAVAITLCFEQRSKRLHPHHAALIYALIRAAFARMNQTKAALPDGVLIQAPEQLRSSVQKGDAYRFGLAFLQDTELATHTLWQLTEGLRRVGKKHTKAERHQFGGNFRVGEVVDLVSGKPINQGTSPVPVGHDWMLEQVEAATQADQLTLQFTTPLRCGRANVKQKRTGHRYLDRHLFDPATFFSRIINRLKALGDQTWHNSDLLTFEKTPIVVDNGLVWLDIAYGSRERRKTLGGCVGSVRLRGLSPNTAALLAVGQLIHVGENTRFGFGRYYIAELNDDPFFATRSKPLLQLALEGPALDTAADRYEIESGTARQAAKQLLAGQYEPAKPFHISIKKSDGSRRRLAVPQKLDRVLQRAVNDLIAPAIDQFLESSSMAYRHGLGRNRAAKRVAKAYEDGYRWAVKADFYQFFDTVDHEQLQQRLVAYIGDAQLIDVLMMWVRNGATSSHRGLPTGAVISPLLANLFLDRFDERIEQLDARLVRYADDFLILCKSPEQAKTFFEKAQTIANEFQLALNQEKTQLLDLVEGFDFLGFRFQRKQDWQTSSDFTVAHVDEIGWQQQTKQQKARVANIALPGESQFPSRGVASTVILGPHIRSLDADGKSLRFARADGKFQSIGPLTSVENVLVLGKADVSSQLVGKLAEHDVDLLMTDDIGRPLLRLGQGSTLSAELVRQQVLHSSNPVIQQFISFELLHAKITNYAALADGCRGCDRRQTGDDLRSIAKRLCRSQSVAQLRGHEGHAAAIWYGRLKNRVASSHVFARRISPNAEDPINILLNLGFTQLYRLTEGLLEVNGLVPTIGFLHDDRSGHQSLASDIMEPFRFLVDRAVVEASAKILPKDFRESNGPYPVNISPPALREFQRILFQTLSLGVSFDQDSAAVTYRMQIARVVRRLKRFLMDTKRDFVVPEFHRDGSGRPKPKSIQ